MTLSGFEVFKCNNIFYFAFIAENLSGFGRLHWLFICLCVGARPVNET